MRTIHIHARDIVRYDAVGIFSRQIAELASQAGWRAKLWAGHSDQAGDTPVGMRDQFWEELGPEDLVFFNYSIFDPILERVANLPNRKVCYFHNITPVELIDPMDALTIENCREGIAQRYLAERFDLVMANSHESARFLLEVMPADDLARLAEQVVVVPPVIGADRWKAVASDASPIESGGTALLYVGRLVSHKGIDRLLNVFEQLALRRPDLSLDIVGGPAGTSYVGAVKLRAAAIAAETGSTITVHHGISDRALKRLYQRASACLTFSRHEGFCVPALDALAFDKPFFMAPLPALAEVMGAAALFVDDNPTVAAGQIDAFLRTPDLMHANGLARRARMAELLALADGRIIFESVELVGGG